MTNAVVTLGETGDVAFAMKRLKKLMAINGTLSDMRRHEHFIPPSLAKRVKSQKARAKTRKADRRRLQHDPRERDA